MASRGRHGLALLGGPNYGFDHICILDPDLRGCLYEQRIQQKSKEFDTVRLVRVDKENIYLKKLMVWLEKRQDITRVWVRGLGVPS